MNKDEFIRQWLYLDRDTLTPEDPAFKEALHALNSVIKAELEKFVEWYNNEYATPILPIDKEDIEDYLNQTN